MTYRIEIFLSDSPLNEMSKEFDTLEEAETAAAALKEYLNTEPPPLPEFPTVAEIYEFNSEWQRGRIDILKGFLQERIKFFYFHVKKGGK